MAEWCTRHARGVVVGWIVAVLAVTVAGMAAGGERNRAGFRLPGTDSQAANDLIARAFPGQRGDVEAVVVSTTTGSLLAGPPRQRARTLFDRLRHVEGVRSVTDPLSKQSIRSGAGAEGAVSLNHRTAIAVLRFDADSLDVPHAAVSAVIGQIKASRTPTFGAAATGWAIENSQITPPKTTEIVGFLAATIVLLLALGGAVAAALALGNALVALGVSTGVLQVASHVADIPYFGPQVALTVGLGIGIDYALLTVARYRGAREQAPRGSAATVEALRRTSRTVTFAGGTMVIAITGLLVTPMSMVRGMTLAVVIAVVPAVLAANTLLPALLHLADAHLDRGRILRRHAEILESSPRWGRWSARVQRRPVTALLASVAVLGLLALPVLWLRLGPADGSTDNPRSMTSHAYQMASTAFGPGATSPLTVVAHTPDGTPVHKATRRVRHTLVATPGVLAVTRATYGADRHYALFDVIPTTAPDDPATIGLLERLRTTKADALGHHDIAIGIGGQAALQYDMASTIRHAFPTTVLIVIGSSFLLLLIQFRSLAIAAKAGVMNLLSIGAAFADHGGDLPVGLGHPSARDQPSRRDPLAAAALALPDPLRLVDGLRGLSDVTHHGRVGTRSERDRRDHTGHCGNRPRGHFGCRHHVRAVRGDGAVGQSHRLDLRRRVGPRRPAGRDHHPQRAAAGDDAAARSLQLVAAELADAPAATAASGLSDHGSVSSRIRRRSCCSGSTSGRWKTAGRLATRCSCRRPSCCHRSRRWRPRRSRG
ncbi:MAG TPA: MMPL family transporter [Mycobacteriales bacterium]|nr:MMPL family transporter [Mycobacteriales bacterium]